MGDFKLIRTRREEPTPARQVNRVGGSPAFVGRVASTGSAIGIGKFMEVNPVSLLGTETEGGAGSKTVDTSLSVLVYLLGPRTPSTGDDLVCRFVDWRWVAQKTGPPGPCSISGTVSACGGTGPYNTLAGGYAVIGATVTLSQSGVVVASTATSLPYGGWVLTFPASGTYDLKIAYPGCCDFTASYTVACPLAHGIIVGTNGIYLTSTTLRFAVSGCLGTIGPCTTTYQTINAHYTSTPAGILAGATLQVYDSTSAAYGPPVTTTGTGLETLSIPCTYPYTVQATAARFNACTFTYTGGLACTSLMQLGPASGYVCVPCCNVPLAKTLYATSSIYGAVTLTWQSSGAPGAGGSCWLGTVVSGGVTITFILWPLDTTAHSPIPPGNCSYSGPAWGFTERSPTTPLGAGYVAASCPPGFSLSFTLNNSTMFGGGSNNDGVTVTE